MQTNDKKYYLNIYENLPNSTIRWWMQIGFGAARKDVFVFDPCLRKEVHFSFHSDGNLHIRNGAKSKKYGIFKNRWFENPNPDLLKQLIYFRPANNSYPIVSGLANTPQTINQCYKFFKDDTLEHTIFPNMLFKVLLGAPTASTYRSFHKHGNEEPNIITGHEKWKIGLTVMPMLPREEHDNGTFIYFFNTSEDIPDIELFSGKSTFEIGPKTLTSQFVISKRSFGVGEVACIYYRL